MSTRMLIDASHPEETRVVVVKGTRLEEFDFESATKKQLKGNIYLAKVTRVEPSLQAAFVEYGGNRHGFLAFSEIHPDYYQIPIADRQALLAEQAAEDDDDEDDDEDETVAAGASAGPADHGETDEADGEAGNEDAGMEAAGRDTSNGDETEANASDDGDSPTPAEASGDEQPSERSIALEAERPEILAQAPEAAGADDELGDAAAHEPGEDAGDRPVNEATEITVDDTVESVGAEDSVEEAVARARRPRKRPLRSYKIQEVIKRRQILLVQVVKEERGNKGAALTTYLSLAGRYCVLMPNSPRGGGISRKIQNAADRKRLKSITADLDVPEGMGVIVRTAGMNRTKPEIKRDFEYLLRLWDSVRDLTLRSSAPALVYEEGDLIKRAIRDLYSKDIEEILVEGEEGYRQAKDFMRMLMPSHAKNVQPYRDRVPLFHRFQVEHQLDQMFNPVVQLKSGGYIVINTTEALVAVDVNSGRSTREHNIEETATKTNLEAAEEVARQMRLRDLAGLIVIDFIDMEDSRNNRAVERKLKDCLKTDRARIQLGRISPFGLLEMSRQRLHPGLLEASTHSCVHCRGAGVVRSTESSALHVLRAIEDEGIKERASAILVKTAPTVALYVLNQKRHALQQIEARYDFSVTIEADEDMIPPEHRVERLKPRTAPVQTAAVNMSSLRPVDLVEDEDEDVIEADAELEAEEAEGEAQSEERRGRSEQEGDDGKRRRRRRRRRGRRDEGQGDEQRPSEAREQRPESDEDAGDDADEEEAEGDEAEATDDGGEERRANGDAGEGNGDRRRRRRGRRGGRRRRDGDNGGEAPTPEAEAPVYAVTHWPPADESSSSEAVDVGVRFPEDREDVLAPSHVDEPVPAMEHPVEAPRYEPVAAPLPLAERDPAPAPAAIHWPDAPPETVSASSPAFPEAHDPNAPGAVVDTAEAVSETAPAENAAAPEDDAPKPPPRRGWWQRRFGPT
jgi:ribonuclease E